MWLHVFVLLCTAYKQVYKKYISIDLDMRNSCGIEIFPPGSPKRFDELINVGMREMKGH